jgi:four helix bundle protein
MFRFEKLDVWHRALELADDVYAVTRRFPDDERFGLTSQMRRSSVSISSNVAEGSGRISDNDFARFVEMAYSSLMGVVSEAFIAKRQRFLTEPEFDKLYAFAEEIARMLSSLRNKLLSGS